MTRYGKALVDPIEVPLAKNCTPVIAPLAAVAVATTVVEVLTDSVEPVAGALIETVGGVEPPPPPPTATTVIETAGDVVCVPTLSVATAVSDTVPVADGVQGALYGEVVSPGAASSAVPLA